MLHITNVSVQTNAINFILINPCFIRLWGGSEEHLLPKDTMRGMQVISLNGGSYFFNLDFLKKLKLQQEREKRKKLNQKQNQYLENGSGRH